MFPKVNTEFQLQNTKSNTKRIKINPLYTLLTEFSPEIAAIVPHYDLRKMQKCNAYLINFATNDEKIINLFSNDDYTLCKRHLRIDEKYVKNQHGLTPSHYTEKYLNPILNLQIVVHAYFNTAGNYTFAAIKQTNLTSKQEILLEVSQQHLQAILSNLTSPSILLRSLIKYKNELYQDALDKSYALELELQNLTKGINTDEGFTHYTNKCDEFRNCIKKINTLNEISFDPRGKIVHKLIEQFLANKKNNEVADDDNDMEEIVPTIEMHISPIQSQPQVNKKIKLNKLLEDLIIQSKKYIQQANSLFINNNINENCHTIHNLMFDMQLKLLEFFNFPSSIRKQNKRIINKLEKSIANAKNFIKSSLIQAIEIGDINTLKNIFPISQSYLDHKFYFNFITNIMKINEEISYNNTTNMQQSFVACDFLHAQSDIFRSSMLFFMYTCFYSGNTGFSVLLKAYINKNLFSFKKLIEYGSECKYGIINTQSKQCLPLLNVILYLTVKYDNVDPLNMQFIDALLDNNIQLLSGAEFSKQNIVISLPYNNELEINTQTSELDKLTTHMFNQVYELSPLEIAARYIENLDLMIIQKLISRSSIKSIALTVAYCSSLKYVRTAIASSIQINGVYLSTHEDKPTAIKGVYAAKNANKLMHWLSIDPDKSDKFKTFISLICKSFNHLFMESQNNLRYPLISEEYKSKRAGLKSVSDTHIRKMLKLPDEYTIGEAIDNGGCFFDSFAQLLNAYNNTEEYTEKSLRLACCDYVSKNSSAAISLINADKNSNISLANYDEEMDKTGEEIEVPQWGRTDVEGIMLCRQLDLDKFYVYEIGKDLDGHEFYSLCEVTKEKVINIGLSDLDLNKPTLIVKDLHFVPILPKNKINNKNKSLRASNRDKNEEEHKHNNIKQINHIIKEILADVASNNKSTTTNYKLIQLDACLFLLSQKPELTFQDALLVVNLFKKIAQLYENDLKNKNFSHLNYTKAKIFIDCSKYKLELESKIPDACFITTQYNSLVKKQQSSLLLQILLAVKKNNYDELLACFKDPALYYSINIDDYSLSGDTNQTALHNACGNNSYACAKLLILFGAYPYHKNNTGKTPLDLLTDAIIKGALIEIYEKYTEVVENNEEIKYNIISTLCNQNPEMLYELLPFIDEIESYYFRSVDEKKLTFKP
jgi:hypothetical protein